MANKRYINILFLIIKIKIDLYFYYLKNNS